MNLRPNLLNASGESKLPEDPESKTSFTDLPFTCACFSQILSCATAEEAKAIPMSSSASDLLTDISLV
jgi:hypothetical protein